MPVAQQVLEAVAAIRGRTDHTPRVALILGSGLGDLADEIQDPLAIPYRAIPHFPVSTVMGHVGEFVFGTLEGVPVVAMRGRVHFYEGYSLPDATLPVRVMRRLGSEVLIVTNAAGGINASFRQDDLMLLTDHLNFPGMAGQNPLIGLHEPELGVRFLDLTNAYDPELRALAQRVAEERGFSVQQGVYAMLAGPSFETPAEIHLLRTLGADAVGMSTVPEVIVARHETMRVLGISTITNMAAGHTPGAEVTHQEVLESADRVKPRLIALVRGVVAALA